MELLNKYLELGSQSFFWYLPLFLIFYVFFLLLKKLGMNIFSPYKATIFISIIAALTLPTIPKYNFANEVNKTFKDASEFRLVNSSSAVSLAEPLALIKSPATFFLYVSPLQPPQSSGYSFGSDNNSFIVIEYKYKELPTQEIIDADCTNTIISISKPVDGTFKYIDERPMFPQEKATFCINDYTYENDIAFCKVRKMFENSTSDMDQNQLDKLIIQFNNECLATVES